MLHVVPLFKVGHRGAGPNKRFKDAAASIRVRIEHAFGMLKSRFMSLQGLKGEEDTSATDRDPQENDKYLLYRCLTIYYNPAPCQSRLHLVPHKGRDSQQ